MATKKAPARNVPVAQAAAKAGKLAPMSEERSPSVDGVIPARIESHNEWPQMRSSFCRTGRDLRAQTFTPSAFAYPQPDLPGVAATATCTVAPVY